MDDPKYIRSGDAVSITAPDKPSVFVRTARAFELALKTDGETKIPVSPDEVAQLKQWHTAMGLPAQFFVHHPVYHEIRYQAYYGGHKIEAGIPEAFAALRNAEAWSNIVTEHYDGKVPASFLTDASFPHEVITLAAAEYATNGKCPTLLFESATKAQAVSLKGFLQQNNLPTNMMKYDNDSKTIKVVPKNNQKDFLQVVGTQAGKLVRTEEIKMDFERMHSTSHGVIGDSSLLTGSGRGANTTGYFR